MSSLPSHVDSVAAPITEERLPDVLSLIHREGFGHNAQVIRPERGRTVERLCRAGLDSATASNLAAQQRPVILIFAPERVDAAEIVLRRGGATQPVRYRQQSGTQSALIGFDPVALQPRRSGRRGGSPR